MITKLPRSEEASGKEEERHDDEEAGQGKPQDAGKVVFAAERAGSCDNEGLPALILGHVEV